MKTILFFVLIGLFVWTMVLTYSLLMKIAVAINFPKSDMQTLFWLSIVLAFLTALFKLIEE